MRIKYNSAGDLNLNDIFMIDGQLIFAALLLERRPSGRML
jgi:hypothetical protein